MKTVLTLDLGSSSIKSALVDADGRFLAFHTMATPITRSRDGLCEMDPLGFRAAVTQAVGYLGRAAPGGLDEVSAVTFSTQSNSFLLLDGGGRPLTPVIIWADERARSLEHLVLSISQAAGFQQTTGVVQLNWQYAPAKLLWLRSEQPDVWRETNRFCLISDYLTLWLAGRHVTETGVAGLLGLVDIQSGQWWEWACEQSGLPRSWLPAITRAGTDLGPIATDAADALGLPRSCRFVVGCLDQYAGAMGAGNSAPGVVSETTGTVLATLRCTQGFDSDAAATVFQGPAFDAGVYYQMLFSVTSASLLQWYRESLPDRPSFESLCGLAAGIEPGSEGLRFRPAGDAGEEERAPDQGFIGRRGTHTRGHAVRSIMERVALALDDQIERLCGSRLPIEVRSGGGAARCETWLQIKADMIGIPFVRTQCPAPACLGAAMLAARALGWGEPEDLSGDWVRTMPPREPDAYTHAFYRAWKETMLG